MFDGLLLNEKLIENIGNGKIINDKLANKIIDIFIKKYSKIKPEKRIKLLNKMVESLSKVEFEENGLANFSFERKDMSIIPNLFKNDKLNYDNYEKRTVIKLLIIIKIFNQLQRTMDGNLLLLFNEFSNIFNNILKQSKDANKLLRYLKSSYDVIVEGDAQFHINKMPFIAFYYLKNPLIAKEILNYNSNLSNYNDVLLDSINKIPYLLKKIDTETIREFLGIVDNYDIMVRFNNLFDNKNVLLELDNQINIRKFIFYLINNCCVLDLG